MYLGFMYQKLLPYQDPMLQKLLSYQENLVVGTKTFKWALEVMDPVCVQQSLLIEEVNEFGVTLGNDNKLYYICCSSLELDNSML